jgi:hypothetical protein
VIALAKWHLKENNVHDHPLASHTSGPSG